MSKLSVIYHSYRALVMFSASIVVASLLAFSAFTASAADMSGWSNKAVCRLVTEQADNAVYLAEAQRRGLDCGISIGNVGNNASNSAGTQQSKKLLPKNQGIVIYSVKLDPQTKQQLLSQPINRTEFDFSAYQLATVAQPITCQFNLRRVNFNDHVEGKVENWNIAQGRMLLTNDGVKIEGHWRMGGLSKDPSYLKHEVNLKLTKAGHLVGKMAYFHLNVNAGEVFKNPVYVELKPHKRSKPLNINESNKAELWTDVEDWAGGVWQLTSCQEYTP